MKLKRRFAKEAPASPSSRDTPGAPFAHVLALLSSVPPCLRGEFLEDCPWSLMYSSSTPTGFAEDQNMSKAGSV